MSHFWGNIHERSCLVFAFLVLLSGLCIEVEAATYYVRAGATGNNDGSDWANAYSSFPPQLERGATYYVASGEYGSLILDDALVAGGITAVADAGGGKTTVTTAGHGLSNGDRVTIQGARHYSGQLGQAEYEIENVTTDTFDIDIAYEAVFYVGRWVTGGGSGYITSFEAYEYEETDRVKVTTSSAHGLTTSDKVNINPHVGTLHGGYVAGNNQTIVAVPSDTEFVLSREFTNAVAIAVWISKDTPYVTVKKATGDDHGTETGWKSTYADGQAVFGTVLFHTGYYIFDGQTGGGPGSWETGHGFKFVGTSAGSKVLNLRGFHWYGRAPFPSHITIKHAEITHRGRYAWNNDVEDAMVTNAANSVITSVSRPFAAGDVGKTIRILRSENNLVHGPYTITSVSDGAATLNKNATNGEGDGTNAKIGWELPNDDLVYSSGPTHHVYIGYCWIHDVSRLPINTQANASFWTLEYSKIARNSSVSGVVHSEAWQAMGCSDITVRYNWFEDIEGTGVLVFKVGPTTRPAERWYVYGNVFALTPEYRSTGGMYGTGGGGTGHGILTDGSTRRNPSNEGGDTNYIYFYNNTIIHWTGARTGHEFYHGHDIYIKNNVYYDIKSAHLGTLGGTAVITADYNAWLELSGPAKPVQLGDNCVRADSVADPFVDWKNGDFRLTTDAVAIIGPGEPLPAPYNHDMHGKPYMRDGQWMRGAVSCSAAAE